MRRNSGWWAYRLVIMMGWILSLLSYSTPAQAQTLAAESLCGNGSPPDYGFTYRLLQPHWTVGWENYASEQTINQVDQIFDKLNDDAIAQTMIIILPQDQVGIRPNCAVHFLRYMKLGLPSGERKDNGFVFLIVVEPNSIDVHYAVGLGLPALTAPELTDINRAAEDTYQSTHSMDQTLLTLANEFNKVARDNYEPVRTSVPTPEAENQPSQPTGTVATLAFCGQVCLGLIIFLFFIWMVSQMRGGGGGGFYRPSGGWGSGGSPWGGGFGGFRTGGGRGGSSPRMRGGSGSGRSGRTN